MRKAFFLVAIAAVLVLAAAYVGYRAGVERTTKRLRAEANEPEADRRTPAEWRAPVADNHALPPAAGETCLAPTKEPPFAIDITRPARITWPLDIGPDDGPDRPDERIALRGRQGVNELQERGAGRAFYPFRLAKPEKLRAWFRCRWVNDGVGSIACNNSWFVGFDDRPAQVIEGSLEDWDRGVNAWHWEQGPAVELSEGVHWLRVELREDGVLMDRAALLPAKERMSDASLDAVAPSAFAGFAGERPPFDSAHPIAPVEFCALPTGSLAIGSGHVNQVTVAAVCHGPKAFKGTIHAYCRTATKLAIEGDSTISCSPEAPFARNVLTLRFPDDAARREHPVVVSVTDDSGTVFEQELRFVKGWAWAFLGPFRAKTLGSRGGQVSLDDVVQPCDASPQRLAAREDASSLGLASLLPRGASPEWRVISDGSCCDWTGAVDLERVYGKRDYAFAYAVSFIRAETVLHHRSFEFQADDAGWLWMNGETVVTSPVNLPRECNRLWSSAKLDPGANAVVVKLLQLSHYWGYRVDVIDWHWQGRRGDVITGLEPANWPERK